MNYLFTNKLSFSVHNKYIGKLLCVIHLKDIYTVVLYMYSFIYSIYHNAS